MQKFTYNNYNKTLQAEFSERVQKISLNAGFTCPNRDGVKGFGGCTYCNNQSFLPDYCLSQKSVTQQINEGIAFFEHKYRNQKYLAYFQSYTNTYADFDTLVSLYSEALAHPQIVGLVIGTRPDCVNEKLLDYFAKLAERQYIMLEYGVESTNDETLRFINRGHDYRCAADAICETARRGIRTAAHLILGLPHESRETIISHSKTISELPLTALKLHQLQIIKNTVMARQYAETPELFTLFTADEYIDLIVDFLENLNPDIAIERFVSQSPAGYVVAPEWGLKNFEFTAKIEKRLRDRQTWQGRFFMLINNKYERLS
ncbi:MAG: TIGR01212 family radical SAM protein [Paludibacter sp.]|jgi:radical SAM protein (TIGR01212 family)|nr:TIGR01212 family radical SAM protein [Paludibacter sp.]